MTQQEYNDRYRVLVEQFIRNVGQLNLRYATSQSPHRVGDTIQGYTITDIHWCYNDDYTDIIAQYYCTTPQGYAVILTLDQLTRHAQDQT